MILSKKYIADIFAPAVCVCGIAYFAFGAILGPTGYLTLSDLEADLTEQQKEVDGLQAHRDYLENHAKLLNPKSLDPDMVDEKVRSMLGYTNSADIVILRKEVERLIERARAEAE